MNESIDALRAALHEAKGRLGHVHPPATETQLAQVEARLGTAVTPELHKLLALTAGVDSWFYPTGELGVVGVPELCPTSIPVYEDGFGNQWLYDVGPEGRGRVIYWCHDPPVVVAQTTSIIEFAHWVVRCEAWDEDETPQSCDGGPLLELDKWLRRYSELGDGAVRLTVQGRTQERILKEGERATIDFDEARTWDGFWWAGPNSEMQVRRVGPGAVFEVWR